MNDFIFQVDKLKLELDKIKPQLDNLLVFKNMYPFSFQILEHQKMEEPLISLGIQIINIGIRTLTPIFNISKYYNKYQAQIKQISEEIKYISTPQQMMQMPPMMQIPQILQQQIISQQIIPQPQINEPETKKVSLIFQDSKGKITTIRVNIDTRIEQLYKIYMDEAPLYGNDINNLVFRYNDKRLDKNDKTKLIDYFGYVDYPRILVFFNKEILG